MTNRQGRGLLVGLILVLSGSLTGLARTTDEPALGFRLLGTLRPRPASEISGSIWSVGGETLDRDFAVYDHYKSYLGPLGVKAIRLQAGWAKCEQRKGAYDWRWLDHIVDDALAQGVRPWLQTSYGNSLYPGGGGEGLGDGLPTSVEALEAWDAWVHALVRRYKGRVTRWEVWNEPDLGPVTPEAYAEFFVRTAEVIRGEQPEARIDALALCYKVDFAKAFFDEIRRRGKLGLIDAVTIHGYQKNPDQTALVDQVRALLSDDAKRIGVSQGENGAPSTKATFGALNGHPWTELTQAKWTLRRMLAHLGKDVPFNLFTLMELQYPTGLNTKGLLKTRDDKTVAYAKPAYAAAQNVTAVFDDTLTRIADYPVTTSWTKKVAIYAYRSRREDQQLVTIWFSGEVPSDSNETTAVDFTFSEGDFREPVYVDLRLGRVHAIPEANWSREGDKVVFRQIPIYDSPILIAEKSALSIRSVNDR